MTARELLRHCFPWEIRPGVAAPEEDFAPEVAPEELPWDAPVPEGQAAEPAAS